jgi:hypothetical protein
MVIVIFLQQSSAKLQGSGFRESARADVIIRSLLPHGRIGPAAIIPRQLLLS